MLARCVLLVFLCLTMSVSALDKLIVVGKLVNVRSGPTRNSNIVGKVRNGQYVRYEGTSGLWTKIGEYAYIPTVYALPQERVEFIDGVAKAKTISNLTDPLVTPVAQQTTNLKTNETSVTQLQVPVTVPQNLNGSNNTVTNTTEPAQLNIVDPSTTTSIASKDQPNKVSTTTAVKQLEQKTDSALSKLMNELSALNVTVSGNATAPVFASQKQTSTSTSTEAGNTLMGILKSKPADLSTLKTYNSKHIKSKSTVDSLNNVEAIYDTDRKTETEYTCDEFVKRYYRNTLKIDVALDSRGVPASGFSLTLSPKVGDLVVSPHHRAIVKQAAGEVIVLIEQNYKWSDKKKTGFYAAKNRRLTLRQGIGIDSIGTKYTFYTPKTQ